MNAAIPNSQVHISGQSKFDEGIKSIPIEDIEEFPQMKIDYVISDNRLHSKAVLSYKDSAQKLAKLDQPSAMKRIQIRTI